MNELATKIKVILTALPTWLAASTLVLTVAAQELIPLLPDNWAAKTSALVVTLLAIIAAIVNTVRRLTPALPSTFGILPVDETARRRAAREFNRDTGHATSEVLVSVLVVVVIFVILLRFL